MTGIKGKPMRDSILLRGRIPQSLFKELIETFPSLWDEKKQVFRHGRIGRYLRRLIAEDIRHYKGEDYE